MSRTALAVGLTEPRGTSPATAPGAAGSTVAPSERRWTRPRGPAGARDLAMLRADAGAVETLHVPDSPLARRMDRLVRALPPRLRSAPPGVDEVLDLVPAPRGTRWDSCVTMASSRPGRRVLGLLRSGELVAVVKCTPLPGDTGLRREADLLTDLYHPYLPFGVPRLLDARELPGGGLAVVLSPVPGTARDQRPDVTVALGIAQYLGRRPEGPLVHGDLSPWNVRVVDARPWVLDWEDARFQAPAMEDLCQYVLQHSRHVARIPASRAVELLVARGRPGPRYLQWTARDPRDAPEMLRSFLHGESATARVGRRYRDRALAALGGTQPGPG